MLRLHLGLIVPEPREQLGIRVDHAIYRWREGEAVIFDDAYEHEAWNRSDRARVIVLMDCWNPHLTPPEREAVKALIEGLRAAGAASLTGCHLKVAGE